MEKLLEWYRKIDELQMCQWKPEKYISISSSECHLNATTMSTHHPDYPNINRHRAGSSLRRTLHADTKNDKPTNQPYSDHQAPNISNQMAANLSLSVNDREINNKQAGHRIHQVSFNGCVMISIKKSHEIEWIKFIANKRNSVQDNFENFTFHTYFLLFQYLNNSN